MEDGDSARAAALELFDGRYLLVAKKAHRQAWLRDLNRTDREDLVQESLFVFWGDCERTVANGGDATSISTKYSVSRGWRRFCMWKWPKRDAMKHAHRESDIEAKRRQRCGEHIGAPGYDDEGPTSNSPLDELAQPVHRIDFGVWRRRLEGMPEAESGWLRFLFTSGISATKAAARLGITRQSLEAHLRRDPEYGKRLGGRVFHRLTGRDYWLFPPNVEDFLQKGAAVSKNSGVLKYRRRESAAFHSTEAQRFFLTCNSYVVSTLGEQNGIRPQDAAPVGA